MLRHTLDAESSLQLLEARHAAELFALVDANRERLRSWLLWVDQARAVDDTRAFIEKSLRDLAGDEGLTLGIWRRERVAGVIGVAYRQIDSFAEIGYWIGSEHEGQGLVTKSVRAVLRYLFGKRDLHRVEIRCASGNARSCRIPERLGFKLEGVLREAARLTDRFEDLRVYGLLQAEWKAWKQL